MSEVSGSAAPGRPRLASLPRRLGAALYESLELAAIVLLGGALSLPLGSSAQPLGLPSPIVRMVTAALVLGLVTFYCTSLWSGGRRTLAMRTWRMHLVGPSGDTLSWPRALVRLAAASSGALAALVAYIPLHHKGWGAQAAWCLGVNFAWALVDRDRQFLHDRLAGTRMVDDRPAKTVTPSPEGA